MIAKGNAIIQMALERFLYFFGLVQLKRLQWQLKRRNSKFFFGSKSIIIRGWTPDARNELLLCNVRHRNVSRTFLQVLTEKLLQIPGNARHPSQRASIIHRASSKCWLRRVLCSTAILTKFSIRACNLRVRLRLIGIHFVQLVSLFVADDEWWCEAEVSREGNASFEEASFYDILIRRLYGKLMVMGS